MCCANFFTVKNIVMEERRLRTKSQPTCLIEVCIVASFKAHPFGEIVVGHMSDLKTMTRAEAEAFFKKYYVATNLTIAIAGDVSPAQVKQLAQTYFGRLPSAPKPDPVETIEPEQLSNLAFFAEFSDFSSSPKIWMILAIVLLIRWPNESQTFIKMSFPGQHQQNTSPPPAIFVLAF